MINEKMQTAFCDQINKELYSEYLYLSMKAYFLSLNLNGFATWMDVQVQEEHAHAMGMFDYVIERGGKVELHAIEKPETSWIWLKKISTSKYVWKLQVMPPF